MKSDVYSLSKKYVVIGCMSVYLIWLSFKQTIFTIICRAQCLVRSSGVRLPIQRSLLGTRFSLKLWQVFGPLDKDLLFFSAVRRPSDVGVVRDQPRDEKPLILYSRSLRWEMRWQGTIDDQPSSMFWSPRAWFLVECIHERLHRGAAKWPSHFWRYNTPTYPASDSPTTQQSRRFWQHDTNARLTHRCYFLLCK